MSKIKINELNTTSLEVLNTQETAEVVGGVAVVIPTLTIIDASTDVNVGSIGQNAFANSFNLNDSVFGGGIGSSNGNSQSAALVQTNN